jgi:hypothetical protein
MSSQPDKAEMQPDWEISPEGLYIATRHFLLRRGYCCSNRCRNCPYINWHARENWDHAPAVAVQHTGVPARTLAWVRAHLEHHEQAFNLTEGAEQIYHQKMIIHYRHLLERWG